MRLQPYCQRRMPKPAFSSAGCSSAGLPLPQSHTHVAMTLAIPHLSPREPPLSPIALPAAGGSQRDQPSWTKPRSQTGLQEPWSQRPEKRDRLKMSVLNPQ